MNAENSLSSLGTETARSLKKYSCMSDDAPGYLIKQVYVSLTRMLDQEVAPLDMTAMQWRPLIMLATQRASTSAELARLNGVDTGAMTRTLDRLEAKGLITRSRNANDRRVIDIALTPLGLETSTRIPPCITRTAEHHLRGFSEEETKMLSHFLQRMLANGSVTRTDMPK